MTAAAEHAVVGPYRIVKAIGAGGSARIDLARIDRAYGFQRHVVIKRPLEHLRSDPSVAASLRREAHLGGQLRHPNLVAVLDAGEHDGYDYLALEYIHGASLRTLMQPAGGTDDGTVRALPLGTALSIVIEVARGLHEAHELAAADGTSLGLVHRDVSPNNILLGADGTVKLADFGIAKDTRVSTLSGSMRGTVTYMAPEQCRGHAFDRRADVFSLGVILFELVTARRLFWADNDVASLHKVLSGVIPDPRSLVPGLAPELAAILVSTVAADPDARFATAAALADALEAYAVRVGVATSARHVARIMESALGVRGAPWIEVAPAPAEIAAFAGEASLVGVIESTLDEPEAEFAPAIAADIEPTVVDAPQFPVAEEWSRAARPAPSPKSRRRTVVIALALAVAGAASIAFFVASRSASTHAEMGSDPIFGQRPGSAAPRPKMGSDPIFGQRSEGSAAPAIEIDPSGAATTDAKQRRRRRMARDAAEKAAAAKPPVEAPTTAIMPTAPAAATPRDAGITPNDAVPARVEWKPTLLLPTDDPKAPAKRRTP